MLPNILGSIVFMAILGVGDAIVLGVLSSAGVQRASVRGGTTTLELRRLAPFIIAMSLLAGAVVGWFAGPIVLDALGVQL